MEDKSKVIFSNPISPKDYRKAMQSKIKYLKKYGDDSRKAYSAKLTENATLHKPLGVLDIRVNEGEGELPFDTEKGIIVGNIRMGFGHYRISIAMASAANALGYTPYWMDLNSYKDTTCTKVIGRQNDLYSLGSRLSQRSRLFNKLIWEPMNYEGFRQLSYNAADQKNAELMAPVFHSIPKEIPLIGTHAWPAQAALHAGMKHVVNAIPDNWPMALHLAEGATHAIQTHQSYMGYRILNGFRKNMVNHPMPAKDLVYTGHYIDHELVANIEHDCDLRLKRKQDGEPMRFLLSIGGAGAQRALFGAVIRYLLPAVREKKAAIYVNVGDYKAVWEELAAGIDGLSAVTTTHFNNWEDTAAFAQDAIEGKVEGVHAFWHENIFEAVYCTNLLMRSADVLLTKPSELAFYPIPKLFLKRIGGHEKWGAIHSAEMGDGTLECEDIPHTLQMVSLFLNEEATLRYMCDRIRANKAAGLYDGAYEVVKLAMAKKKAASSQAPLSEPTEDTQP
ncbi:DUF6937 domain-containing protein [Ruminococcus sp.]|uniref:DUF6937 domain-containing protein n=1 Tax=Ruminococcus sp. TaxID=41978 RepID=UPI00388E378C